MSNQVFVGTFEERALTAPNLDRRKIDTRVEENFQSHKKAIYLHLNFHEKLSTDIFYQLDQVSWFSKSYRKIIIFWVP